MRSEGVMLPHVRRRLQRLAGMAGLGLALAGAALAAVSLAGAAMGPGIVAVEMVQGPGLLTLRDGRTIEGDITETAESVTITANGIVTTVPRGQVLSIEYGTPQERFERRLAAVPADDYEARMDVAVEAFERGLLDFAQEVADGVARSDPGNARASALLDQIERQRQLEVSRGRGVRSGATQAATRRVLRPTTRNVLSDEQINRVRQVELRVEDVDAGRERPRISFRDGVVKRFVDSRPDLQFKDFNGGNDVAKAIFMLREARDEEIREDIHVTSHPTAILEYLRRVEPVVVNGCATSDCHGGDASASFALYNPARDDATSYTNFYLLSTRGISVQRDQTGAFSGEDQQAAPSVGRLIDRGRPEDSLLLTYMLPRERTKYPHPQVEGYNGMVLDVDAENYRIIREWISRTLEPLPLDEYGFEFTLDLPATRPANRPSTRPAGRGSRD